MTLEAWLTFCATEAVLSFIPGPAVLFVVSTALARGTRPGMAASFGILTTNAFYFALSATGVAAVIVASNELFTALKWAGAAYLMWIGLRMLLSPRQEPAAVRAQSVQRSFYRGIVVQGANPKALVFFVALLPQFIDSKAAIGVQIAILGVSSVMLELGVLAVYVVLAVRTRDLAGARAGGVMERVGGGLLIAAGARLALLRSR